MNTITVPYTDNYELYEMLCRETVGFWKIWTI